MEFKGSKLKPILWRHSQAVSGKSKYGYYASQAKKGYGRFQQYSPKHPTMKGTRKALVQRAPRRQDSLNNGEHDGRRRNYEWTDMYKEFERVARRGL